MILIRTLLVLLSISNVQTAVLCLPRFRAPQSVVLTTGPSLISVESGLPSGVAEDNDSASNTEIVWAKSAGGVWGLANVFANEKLYFTRDFLRQTACHRG